MDILSAILIITNTIFGFGAMILLFKERNTKKLYFSQEGEIKRNSFKNSILGAIDEKISYDPQVENISNVLIGSLQDLCEYTVAGSLVIQQDKLLFKAFVHERVGKPYIEHLKTSMIASLNGLNEAAIPVRIDELTTGVVLDERSVDLPASLVHIPMWINGKPVGVISVSSLNPHAFHEKQIVLLYQTTLQASKTLSRIENILITEKSKLTSLIVSLADGVFMIENQAELTMINDAALKLLNIEKKDPTVFDIFAALPFNYNLKAKMEQTIAEGKPTQGEELQIGEKYLQVFFTPVHDYKTATQTEGPKVIGASVLLHDITLEKSMAQMKEDFTHMMVHELRAPLTVIKGSSELMLSNRKLTEEETKKLLAIMKEQAVKMLDEVGSILDAAKLEAGRFTIEKTMGDLTSVLSERIAFFTLDAKTKNLTLVDKVEPHLPPFMFDPKRLGQVVNNLITNAMKFTPEGGSITLSTSHDDKQVTISVTDTGNGIPKDKIGQLFKKYSQVTGSGTQHKGTGLGLFIVDGIVKAHNGTITASSEGEGKGTTFSVIIPFASEELATTPATHIPQGPIPMNRQTQQHAEQAATPVPEHTPDHPAPIAGNATLPN